MEQLHAAKRWQASRARASTAFKRSKKQADGELRASLVQAESATAPLPRNICGTAVKLRAVKRQRSTHRNNESRQSEAVEAARTDQCVEVMVGVAGLAVRTIHTLS